MKIKSYLLILAVTVSMPGLIAQKNRKKVTTPAQTVGQVWSVEKARDWYNAHKWINGADFLPSTAINQLEMWQAGSFDTVTINRELGWAENIGFNTVRVYLHSVAWKQDSAGFK